MAAEKDPEKLLAALQPELLPGDFVFCCVADGNFATLEKLQPLGFFQEREGMSLVLAKNRADAAGFPYEAVFRGITLAVHSSLEAVGFTAAIATRLAAAGIPANVVAACHHDHVFVPADRVEQALQLLASSF